MFTYYENTFCIQATALYGELKVMTENNYQALVRRKKMFKSRKGGAYHKALVSFDSIPERFRKKIIEQVGDPYSAFKFLEFQQFIISDQEAEIFFRQYEMNDGSPLPIEKQQEYTMNASILQACHTIRTNVSARRKAMGGSKIRGIWEKFSEIISQLPQDQYSHSLPTATRSIQDLYNATILNKPNKRYKQKVGYETLIHGNYLNTNSSKLTEESKLWIISRWAAPVNRCATVSQLHREYNQKANIEGWKELKEEKTIYNFINQEDIKPMWWAQRYGELAYKEKYVYQFSTKLPTMRDSLWYSDGTKMNYYYQEDGKMKTCQVYEVMDAYSEVLLGYHISPTENYEAQFNAFKMAAQVAGHKPFQIGIDNQGGHKKLDTGGFLSKIARLKIAAQPYNGKSKTIENVFYRLQNQFLKQDWFFTGQNITTNKTESKANMEMILANAKNLPTLKEVKAVYSQRRKEWNSAPHGKTGVARLEMYLNSVNEQTPEIKLVDMIDLFWIKRPEKVKLSAYGLTFKENKVKHTYMKYREDGLPDLRWLELHIDKSFVIKYDPSDLSLIHIYEETKLGLKHVTEMTPKTEIHRGKQEQEEWESSFIKKVQEEQNKQRFDRRDSTEKLLEQHNELPEQHGLVSPNIKGLEGRKKNKAVKKKVFCETQDIAQLQKDISNQNEEVSIYDNY
jgi:hypothetical protein